MDAHTEALKRIYFLAVRKMSKGIYVSPYSQSQQELTETDQDWQIVKNLLEPLNFAETNTVSVELPEGVVEMKPFVLTDKFQDTNEILTNARKGNLQ